MRESTAKGRCFVMAMFRSSVPALFVLFVMGTSTAGWAFQADKAGTGEKDATQAFQNVSPEFRLSPGDVIQMKFFYNPELNDTVEIRPDGMISMPFIGELSVEGLTITEARLQLEELYQPIVKEPSITMQVREYASQKIYVGGEVLRPGVLPLRGELTLLEAIMEAGGHRHTGSDSAVVLIRKDDQGQPVRYSLFMEAKGDQPAAASIALQPFDVVLVPETRIARLDRWVDQYVRQLIPLTLTAGFTYLKTSGAVVIP